jgi:osmotically-inducible protein OsmY
MTGYLVGADMDAQIAAAAGNSYVFKTFLKGDDIQVASRDGAVTLTGTVVDESHSFLAAETVADLPGVKSVDNRLKIRGGITEKYSDAWMQMMVGNMLMLHRNLVRGNPLVTVKAGLVTLKGEIGSHAEKELASEYARDVQGVKGIDNQMTVAKQTPADRRTVDELIDDASIKAQIKWALAFHRGTSAFRASVSVVRGVVTVSGMAKNAAEKTLVSKRIEDIPGVVGIDNRMTIE